MNDAEISRASLGGWCQPYDSGGRSQISRPYGCGFGIKSVSGEILCHSSVARTDQLWGEGWSLSELRVLTSGCGCCRYDAVNGRRETEAVDGYGRSYFGQILTSVVHDLCVLAGGRYNWTGIVCPRFIFRCLVGSGTDFVGNNGKGSGGSAAEPVRGRRSKPGV